MVNFIKEFDEKLKTIKYYACLSYTQNGNLATIKYRLKFIILYKYLQRRYEAA